MTPEQSLSQLMEQSQSRCVKALERWLPAQDNPPTRLHRAMRYAALNGGKRIRPFLVYRCGEALGASLESLDGPACAVELIHTYSLIHDDLPTMDNDELRRGIPTCHKAFDEATAILAGDSLQALAFHVLSRDKATQVSPDVQVEMIGILAMACGSRGMAGGQALDLQAIGKQLNVAELEYLHIHKTGALIRASAMMGALASPESDPDQVRKLDRYAKCIGLAFQIRDDILDIAGNAERLGKTLGKDRVQDKPTYPSVIGLRAAKHKALELRDEAITSLDRLDARADPLRWLADYVVRRTH
jgi:geranylgeranyl diphosphate synthase type II